MNQVIGAKLRPPSRYVPSIPPTLDAVVMRALDRDLANRFPSARDMAVALEAVTVPAMPREVGEWVERTAAEALEKRAGQVAELESNSSLVNVQAFRQAQPRPKPKEPQPASDSSQPGSGSQLTSLSSVTSAEVGRMMPYRLAAVILASALGALAVVALLWIALVRPSEPAAGAAVASSDAVVPQADSAADASSVATPPEPPTPAAAASPGPSASAAPETKAPRSPPARPPPVAPLPPKPPPGKCDPPYTVDSTGIRHPKPDCI
jgi:serine/threonine-protein kinase